MKGLQMTKWLADVSEASCHTVCCCYFGATLDSSTTVTHLGLVLEDLEVFLHRIAQEQTSHRSGELDG